MSAPPPATIPIRVPQAIGGRIIGNGVTPAAHTTLITPGTTRERALVVVPGSINYFYNTTGERIAAALRQRGIAVDVRTPQSWVAGAYDWCFLINIHELLVSYAETGDAIARVRQILAPCARTANIQLDSAGTYWFRNACTLSEQAGIDLLVDLGLHDQSAYLPAEARGRYHFAFNGLTDAERRIAQAQTQSATPRPIPWALVAHQTAERAHLVRRLVTEVDPAGFVYSPYLAPFTESGPHLNEAQIDAVLRHTRYQVWCSHHEHFYMESERFRQSLLAGAVPVKVLLDAREPNASLPFAYLLLDEAGFTTALRAFDFAATRRRFTDEYRALPSLAESIGRVMAAMTARATAVARG